MRFTRNIALIAVWAFAVAAGAQERAPAIPEEEGFQGGARLVEKGTEDGLAFVTVELTYRDIYGAPKKGLARIIYDPRAAAGGDLLPPFVHVHYEKPVSGAKSRCREGWAVFTAHYDAPAGYPLDISIGDSNNLARAIVQWARRLPFIDRTKLHIDGGSQGGYMALAMAAEFFPVSATTADVPVVNWAYNLNYFEENKDVSGYGTMPPVESPLPVVAMVSELADIHMKSSPVPSAYYLFGGDLSADAYYRVSPISYLERITCPVLIQCATGDMLVPIEQMFGDRAPSLNGDFPEGFTRDFGVLTLNEQARKTFVEAVPADALHVETLPLDDAAWEFSRGFVLGQEEAPKNRQRSRDLLWEPDVQWNVVVFEEGPPLPHSSHSRYQWRTSNQTFVQAHRDEPIAAETLTKAKLRRLLERYTGELSGLPRLTNGAPANRLNFAALEQLDVLTALLDFAQISDAHAARLQSLYAESELKPFGEALDLAVIGEKRAAIVAEHGRL